jgi:organic hydroperoxide reductase OsmC/OhrA
MDDGFEISLDQQADFRFSVRFDGTDSPPLITDEPPPLGGGSGPNPSRLLAAAVANCLAASLLFALRKFKNDPGHIRADARVAMTRNEQNRLRVGRIGVDLRIGVNADRIVQLDRILAQFEDFCVVTQSVRSAIPVDVRVFDAAGSLLKAA